MKKRIEKIFDDFINGGNSSFIRLEFKDNKSYIKRRINKAEITRGNIQYLKESVLNIIGEHEPLDEIFTGEKESKLRKEIRELKSLNEYLRRIYKRDLKKDAPDLNSRSSNENIISFMRN